MSLVYIISAYRLPEQLLRLVTRLRTENATLLVHIDKKASPEVFGAIADWTASIAGISGFGDEGCRCRARTGREGLARP